MSIRLSLMLTGGFLLAIATIVAIVRDVRRTKRSMTLGERKEEQTLGIGA
jgi:hypothetical protein